MSALAAELESISAQPAPTPTPSPSRPRARLKAVASAPASVSTFGFFAILALLVVVGMAIVMVVTTQVGAQSRDLTALRREARELSYEAAALKTELQSVSSTGSLALRAAELGMVPNPYPAFVDLSSKSVLGEPQPVVGDEAPYLTGGSAAPLPTAEQTTPAEEPTPVEETASADTAQAGVGEE